MNNNTRLFLILFVVTLTFTNCKEEEANNDFGQKLEELGEHSEQQKEIYNFNIPDSIDKSLIVAVYYEVHSGNHSILLFSDTNKKTASNISFLPDNTVQIDKLVLKKHNEFASIYGNVEYVVTQKNVTKVVVSGPLSSSMENMRIDNSNIN